MKTLILTSLLLLQLIVYGQQSATTEEGKKVLLKADGTWEYVKEVEVNTEPKFGTFDFRKTSWGMTKDQVKASETEKLEKEDTDLLAYSGTVSSLNAFIIYVFVNDKLVRTRYLFVEEHTNENDYVSDYKSINSALTEKYGKPKSDKEYWSNNLYKTDYDRRGFAVSLGHLKCFSDWSTNVTEITAALTGDNYKIEHVTEYVSKRFTDLEKNKKKEKNKSDF